MIRLDTQLRDFDAREVPAQAQRFEALGFDGVWTFEAAHDPFLPLVLAAAATEKLEIGTNITVAFARSPFAVAQTAWDLQKASGGRFNLGLGTQVRAHVERRFSMPFDRPAARITDYIRCVRAVWDTFQTDARPAYDGEFYRFRLINPFFNPGPLEHPRIPIWLAGVNERMCRAAGEVADGFHVHPVHSVGYLRDVIRPAIAAGAASAGRQASDVALYAPVFAVTGETPEQRAESEAEVRRQISFYGSTPNYRAVLEYLDCGHIAKELSALVRQGEFEAMARLVPDALLDAIAISAAPADLGRALRERYEGVLDRVSLYFPIQATDTDAGWQRFVRDFKK
ncbi:MAG: TIGR03617 family F420-dependent LLM class oxidoreductase [Alphaproteobacteria bacterium]|nr:TIGR03617 family F420-dependent LLM class oxidoreductase [Alphaproteobacteria bacterium]MCB9929930.1 TIGR03617 family F420-dependent LLM class oxidoreductase [Alphaproteobacteria bacterium]